MRLRLMSWFTLGFAAAMFVTGSLQYASAAGREGNDRRHGAGYGPAYVVAESIQGNGHVRGAVRPTSLGRQVQLPSGSWVYCKRSCAETLRVETVDFWVSRDGLGGRSVGGAERGLSVYFGRW